MKNSVEKAVTPGAEPVEDQVKAWSAARPKGPEVERPKKPKHEQVAEWIGWPFMCIGGVVGLIVGALGIPTFIDMSKEAVLSVGMLLGIVCAFVSLLIPVIQAEATNAIRDRRYAKAMTCTGWREYEEALQAWRLEGEERFGHAKGNLRVKFALADAQLAPYRYLGQSAEHRDPAGGDPT